MKQEAVFLEWLSKSIWPSSTECSCTPPFQSYCLTRSQQMKQRVNFLHPRICAFLSLLLNPVCAGRPWHLQGRITEVQWHRGVVWMGAVLRTGSTLGCSLLLLLYSGSYFPVVTKWRGLCLDWEPTSVWALQEDVPCSLSYPLWGRSTSSFTCGFISWTSGFITASCLNAGGKEGRMDKLPSPYWCRDLKSTL